MISIAALRLYLYILLIGSALWYMFFFHQGQAIGAMISICIFTIVVYGLNTVKQQVK